MLLNSVKIKPCSVMGGGGGGARGSQCRLFTIYNSALLLTSGQGSERAKRWWCGGTGGVGGGMSSRKESIRHLRRTNSFIVLQSDETVFLWKSQLLIQQHRLRPNASTFVSPLVGGCDGLRRGSSWYVKNRNTLIKGNKYVALDGS